MVESEPRHSIPFVIIPERRVVRLVGAVAILIESGSLRDDANEQLAAAHG
jgi:hypothetical protein